MGKPATRVSWERRRGARWQEDNQMRQVNLVEQTELDPDSAIDRPDKIDILVSDFLSELNAFSLESGIPAETEISPPRIRSDESQIIEGRGSDSSFGRGYLQQSPFETLTLEQTIQVFGSIARESADEQIESLLRVVADRVNRPEALADVYESRTSLDCEDAIIWLLRGWAYYKTGSYEKALFSCDKSIQLDPDKVHTWCYRGLILLKLGRREEALHSCEQGIALDNADAFSRMTRGIILAALGFYPEASAAFDKAALLGEDSPWFHFRRAQTLLVLGFWRDAAAQLDISLGRFAELGEFDNGESGDLVRSLLPGLHSPEMLHSSIRLLFLLYQKHRMLAVLARGLVESMADVTPAAFSDSDIRLWRNCWKTVSENSPEFHVALRLLDQVTPED